MCSSHISLLLTSTPCFCSMLLLSKTDVLTMKREQKPLHSCFPSLPRCALDMLLFVTPPTLHFCLALSTPQLTFELMRGSEEPRCSSRLLPLLLSWLRFSLCTCVLVLYQFKSQADGSKDANNWLMPQERVDSQRDIVTQELTR